MQRIYLDANASSPPIPEALETIRALADALGNPSSFHEHGRIMRAHLDSAREYVALALNASAKDLIFTSGASEANRLFIDALILRARENNYALKVLISPFEHPSLLKPALLAHQDGFFNLEFLALSPNGALVPDEEKLKNCDVFICCEAHNESGILAELDKFLTLLKPSCIAMSDVSQSLARLSDPVHERIDIASFSAQKMGGLAGVGGLLIRGHAKSLKAPWAGGGQEQGFRPGSEASLLIIALGQAARFIARERKAHQELAYLRDYLESKLSIKHVKIIGANLRRLPNTSAISFLSFGDPEALRIACDMAGLSVGFGAACSGLAPIGSFALERMGLSLHEQKNCVRFSLSPRISKSDIEEALERILAIIP